MPAVVMSATTTTTTTTTTTATTAASGTGETGVSNDADSPSAGDLPPISPGGEYLETLRRDKQARESAGRQSALIPPTAVFQPAPRKHVALVLPPDDDSEPSPSPVPPRVASPGLLLDRPRSPGALRASPLVVPPSPPAAANLSNGHHVVADSSSATSSQSGNSSEDEDAEHLPPPPPPRPTTVPAALLKTEPSPSPSPSALPTQVLPPPPPPPPHSSSSPLPTTPPVSPPVVSDSGRGTLPPPPSLVRPKSPGVALHQQHHHLLGLESIMKGLVVASDDTPALVENRSPPTDAEHDFSIVPCFPASSAPPQLPQQQQQHHGRSRSGDFHDQVAASFASSAARLLAEGRMPDARNSVAGATAGDRSPATSTCSTPDSVGGEVVSASNTGSGGKQPQLPPPQHAGGNGASTTTTTSANSSRPPSRSGSTEDAGVGAAAASSSSSMMGPRTSSSSNMAKPSPLLGPCTSEGRRKVVGNYIIGQTIGEGSYAKVCVAQDRGTGTLVAAKVIDVRALEQRGLTAILEQSRREAAIMKKLHHVNIVDYKSALYAKNEGKLYLIMEYCSGGELFNKIENGMAMPEEEARRYFQDVIFGLQYVHECGIAHRDLKLENILLDADDNAKICDFGFAKTQLDGTLLATPCGSRVYAAPEVVDTRVQYDGFLADIFSAGVILFAMVTARMPYATQQEAIQKKLRFPKNIPLSDSVKDLISGMLEPNPNHRLSISDIVKHPWFVVALEERKQRTHVPPQDLEPTAGDLENAFTDTTVESNLSRAAKTYAQAVASNTHSITQPVPYGRSEQPGMTTYVDAFTLASLMTKGCMDYYLVPTNKNNALVSHSTQFTVRLDAPIALERLQEVLSDMHVRLDHPRPASTGFKVRAFREDGVGNLLVFIVHFIPVLDSCTFVILRRRRGNVLFFNALYMEMLGHLGPCVGSHAEPVVPPRTEEDEEDDGHSHN